MLAICDINEKFDDKKFLTIQCNAKTSNFPGLYRHLVFMPGDQVQKSFVM